MIFSQSCEWSCQATRYGVLVRSLLAVLAEGFASEHTRIGWPRRVAIADKRGGVGRVVEYPGAGCFFSLATIEALYIIPCTVNSYRADQMRELTPRQSQILDMIQEFITEFGMPPTRAEIARELGFRSANAAEEHLRALQKKGAIELVPGASRGIQLKDSLREQMGLPLVGRVAAGSPILAQEHIETHYKIDPALFNPKPHYLLRVEGMSMKNAGILDGDLVAVHRTPEIRSRQIVVARLEDEVTVKRYRQDGKLVWLLPENEDFEPIRVDLGTQALVIEGVVVGVIRDGIPLH